MKYTKNIISSLTFLWFDLEQRPLRFKIGHTDSLSLVSPEANKGSFNF